MTLSHWPGLTDANGRLLGLFAIDPVDDIFHLISGAVAAEAQFVKAYPHAKEFVAQKLRYDPAGIFENKFFLNYGKALAEVKPNGTIR
jgi:hypothetical protein